MAPAIIEISAAFDEPFRLELIEQGYQPTGHNPKAGSELPLSD